MTKNKIILFSTLDALGLTSIITPVLTSCSSDNKDNFGSSSSNNGNSNVF